MDTVFTGPVNWAYDIAILNDTLIWVVGRFEIPDTTGSMSYFDRSFNMIEWNGSKWVPKKILSSDSSQAPSLYSIFVINENDIWVGSSIPRHWDGTSWTVYANTHGWETFYANINAIWGSGPDDVFFVSDGGQINHWNGSGFERMETPTTVHLSDVMGTGPDDVWATGLDVTTGKSTIIHYDGIAWTLLYETGVTYGNGDVNTSIYGDIVSVQTFDSSPGEAWVLANAYGIYHKLNVPGAEAELIPIPYNGHPLAKMRGNHPNDLFVAGHHSGMYHWNGNSLREYELPGDVHIMGMDIKDNKVIAIGLDGGRVIAFRKLN
ncbi:MAG: hypothetical protein D6732_13000 [Methanobacteriota archaeon]|nr:MAG: hypothetical protein D6732_13000 [Euryarchaeota archaeon]